MKFTNAELAARMIFDQKNGWPFCPTVLSSRSSARAAASRSRSTHRPSGPPPQTHCPER